MTQLPRDPWHRLGASTPARIAIGRAGNSTPTREVLSFALAHAQARDAVHAKLDRPELGGKLSAMGLTIIEVESRARDRATYLRRPDLARRLHATSRQRLLDHGKDAARDVAIMIADGLSATAVARQVPPLVEALLPLLRQLGLSVGPIVIAEGARVALGDEVGELLAARLIAVLIGERPGLSSADSLSIYLTYAPQVGRTDAERNCISNIRPSGLPPASAATNLAWLIDAALTMKTTGVTLKDRSDVLEQHRPTPLGPPQG
ncbi:MAG: ethanolamine ammonia-lyase subunit EutC [Hyphomicrobiaceae bacterium]